MAKKEVIKPKLVVFDLDYTLWPFWVDTHVDPPFQKKGGDIIDSSGHKVKPYKDTESLLKHLSNDGYDMAIASRTGEVRGANQLLDLFEWAKYFKYKEIYPGCKINHFKRLKEQSKYEYKEMIFFDDEPRNKYDLEKIGVLTIMVESGVSIKLFNQGIKEYQTHAS